MARTPYLARMLTLSTLEQLKAEMHRLDVARGGIPIMAAKGVQRLIYIEQVPTAAANIIKQEILARGGDLATPAGAAGFEASHVDVVLIGNLTTLRSTISKLYRQYVFDLPLIADAVQNVIVRTTPGYLPVASRPSRQGVVVEETLEDLAGGRIPLEPASHRATGRPTLAEVAGHDWRFGEITHVIGAIERPEQVENAEIDGAHGVLLRGAALDPAGIRSIRERFPGLLVLIETDDTPAAEAAVQAGAQVLKGGENLFGVAAATGLPLVLTYGEETGEDLLTAMARWFDGAMRRAAAAGVSEEQLIFDPGLGLHKSLCQDLTVTRRLRELTSFGRPLLYAPSQVLAAVGLTGGTAAAVTTAISGGADFIVTDDVRTIACTATMTDALVRAAAEPDERKGDDRHGS